MQTVKWVFVFVLLLSLGSPILPQSIQYEIKNLSINEGLSNNTVYSIIEDTLGFVWIATEDGLNRYDGYTVKHYWNDPNDSTSIPSNYISRIFKDVYNNIWMLTFQGICRYNYQTDSFKRYYEVKSEMLNGITDYRIGKSDSQPIFSIVGRNSIISYDSKTDKWFEPIDIKEKIKEKGLLTGYLEDSSGRVWVHHENAEIICYTNNYKQQQTFNLYIEKNPDSRISLYKMIETRDGELICVTQYAIYLFDERIKNFVILQTLEHSLTIHPFADKLFEDSNKRIWITTYNQGVYCYTNKKELLHFPKFSNNYGNMGAGFMAITEDSKQNIWFSSERGLFVLYVNENVFKQIDLNESHLIPSYFLLESKSGALFLSTTYNGVKIIVLRTDKIQDYSKQNNNNSLSQNSIYTILEDKKGKLWVQTQDEGLCSFDKINNKWTHYKPNSKFFQIADKTMCHMIFENEKEIWIGTKSTGLYKFNTETNEIKRITGNLNGCDLSTLYIRSIYEKNKDTLFVGTRTNGLFLFDRIKK